MAPEQAVALVERVWKEIVVAADLDLAKVLLAPDYTYRAPGLEIHGPGGFTDYITAVHERFADIEVEVHEYIADEHRVLSRWTGTGTDRESDRSMTWQGATVSHVAEGRIVDDWEYWDRLELAGQLADGWLEERLVAFVTRRVEASLPSGGRDRADS